MTKRLSLVNERTFYLLLSTLLLLYLAWGAAHLGGFQWDDDEGMNVIKAQLVEAGYRLYQDIWSDQPPLLTWILAGAFNLAGHHVAAGRLVILLFATGGLLGTALIARRLTAPGPALLATTLLALTPHYFKLSRAIMVGLPAKSLGVLALVVAWGTSSCWRLLAAGMLFGTSLLTKPITAYQAIVLAVVVALPYVRLRPLPWRSVVRQWGCLILGSSIVLLPVMVLIGPDFVGQVVGTYTMTRAAYTFSLMANLSWLGRYLAENFGLFTLAAWGIAAWAKTHCYDLGIAVLWLTLTLFTLLIHTPLRSHQFLLLLFPAAILAAAGLSHLGQRRSAVFWLTRSLVLATALISLSWLPVVLLADSGLLIAVDNDRDNWTAVDIIHSAVAPDEFVVTDAPMLAFRAGRLVPPSLAIPSLRRLSTGQLTGRFVTEQTAVTRPRAIVLWDGRFDLLPDYVEQVDQHYALARSFNGGRKRIYMFLQDVQYPQTANFDGEIRLLGYRLDTLQVQPGTSLHVTLYWQTIKQPTAIYKGFVHLLGPERQLLAQQDLIMGTHLHVTSVWRPGEPMIERHELTIPADAPPGLWPLEVGLYEYQSGDRLSILDADGHPTESTSVLLSFQPVVRWPARTLPPQPEFTTGAQFGQVAQLVGYDLQPSRAAAGDTVQIILHWHALSSTPHSYTVFVHALSSDGQLIAQADSLPCSGRCPTYGWIADEYLADQYALVLPTDAPVGPAQVAVGLYDQVTGERLPAQDGQGRPLPDNRALLEGLEVGR